MKNSFAHPLGLAATMLAAAALLLSAPPAARAQAQGQAQGQGVDPNQRPISDVRIQGLKQVPEQLVRNQVRVQKGDPYNAEVVREDIVRITHLGRFSTVTAEVQSQPDGSVVLIYQLKEQPLISDVQVVGNKAINDQELLSLVVLKAGDPVDQFLIDRGEQEIKRDYEKQGYFVTDVTVDKKLLDSSGILIYRIREGPKVKIRAIRFEGNHAFDSKELRTKIKSETYLLIFRKGQLSREQLEDDAGAVREYYQDQGYLDAQVGRRIDVSPDQKDAVVVFFVDEGKRYTVDQIKITGNKVFGDAQILNAMTLKTGDVFSSDRFKKSNDAVADLYGRLGFLDAKVSLEKLYHSTEPKVDVLVQIHEGLPAVVGTVSIHGNMLTKDEVVLRQLRGMTPGQRYDATGLEKTRQRLKESPIFSDGKITVLGQPGDPIRDAVVEVKEANTGSLSFGAGVSSDAGVIGAINLVQKNFDIADLPQSLGELFTGRAFRGAGQYFAIALEPGNELSTYSVTFRDPYLLGTSLFLDTEAYYWTRQREDWNESRLGTTVGVGQAFGDVWSARLGVRAEDVKINALQPNAPVDVLAVAGTTPITSLSLSLTRNTTDSAIFPTTGSHLVVGASQAGVLGGDYNFTNLTAKWAKFWTLDEDFLGRRTVLSTRVEAGYIFPGAPVFERFYAGGESTIRGFDFRGVGPRGIDPSTGQLGSDPVGGDWIFLWNLEYNFPVYQDVIRLVVFMDTGTVQQDFGFDQYRVSIGSGLRIKIPFLGQAPFAFDLGIPVLKQPGDKTRIFSFDIAVPFQ